MFYSASRIHTLLLVSGFLAVSCQRAPLSSTSEKGSKESSTTGPAAAATATSAPALFANPVLPGDFPDPSVVKVGGTYWASATSSNWGPAFPLLKSKNLTGWELVGHVFPDKLPDWADYYFWAPEITQEGNKTYVFYTAHQKGGNLTVAVASADRPEGPYRDHGPLVGQPAGSIDGFPMRDENGQLYLVWKEDGNSINQPTPIWAQPLNEARTALTGEKKELFRNTETWEGNLVEGVSMVRHDDYFYAFYAANGCCGRTCTHGTGVARTKNLLGPWEKNPRNPIMTATEAWKCPGHGTATQLNNRWYLLHHAYAAGSFENVGRQGLLTEFTWNADNWPAFVAQGTAAPASNPVSTRPVADEFTGSKLGLEWQWPIEDKPQVALRGGQLRLTAHPDKGGAALGRHTLTGTYTATTTLLTPAALPAGTTAGLAAHGDPKNALALTAGGGKLQLWERRDGKQQVLAETPLPATAGKAVQLRMQVTGGNSYRFSYSADGTTWTNPLPNDGAINGQFLPPWDRGVRVGVLAQGPTSVTAAFERFTLNSQL